MVRTGPIEAHRPPEKWGFSDLERTIFAGLAPDRFAQVKQIHDSAPKWARKRYLDAARGGKSRKGAMETMCLLCCGWEREPARNCTARGCPLWAYRPGAGRRASK